MDKAILLQKQVRDNSEDLRAYLNDLEKWEADMKRKESTLRNGNGEPPIPTVKNKARKIEDIKSSKKKQKEVKDKPEKIKSYDYAKWDKFDVEAECNKIDQKEEEKEESEEEEEEPSEEYKTRLRDEANYEKERGNQFVKNKKWDEAIACYTHSIGCYSKDPIYFANRALCFLKKEDFHSAEADCTSALQLDSTYVKALQRRAAARENLKQYQDAALDLERVLEIEPHNKESKLQLQKIEKKLGIVKRKRSISPQPSTSKENLIPVTVKKVEPVKTVVKEDKKVQEIIKAKQSEIIEDNKIKETKEPKPESKPIFRKQIPWPDRPSSEIILPVQKLPHQRSKKPLKRIEIIETNCSEIQICTKKPVLELKEEKKSPTNISNSDFDYDDSNALAKILAQTNQIDVDDILKNIEKDVEKSNTTNDKPSDQTKEIKDITKTTEKIKIERKDENTEVFNFSVPKSSVQFYSNWKSMKNNNKSKFLYLKQINPEEIPNIFKDSLESDAMSDIIFILNEYFIENKLPVFNYLINLANVKRFSALTMFMSSKDKSALKKVFEYCENSKEVPEEDIDNLRRKYEL